MATMKEALRAKEQTKELVRDVPGISGVGIAWDERGEPCIRVNVEQSMSDVTRRQIPAQVNAVPIKIEAVGPIRMH